MYVLHTFHWSASATEEYIHRFPRVPPRQVIRAQRKDGAEKCRASPSLPWKLTVRECAAWLMFSGWCFNQRSWMGTCPPAKSLTANKLPELSRGRVLICSTQHTFGSRGWQQGQHYVVICDSKLLFYCQHHYINFRARYQQSGPFPAWPWLASTSSSKTQPNSL